jgi:hypothetical protein
VRVAATAVTLAAATTAIENDPANDRCGDQDDGDRHGQRVGASRLGRLGRDRRRRRRKGHRGRGALCSDAHARCVHDKTQNNKHKIVLDHFGKEEEGGREGVTWAQEGRQAGCAIAAASFRRTRNSSACPQMASPLSPFAKRTMKEMSTRFRPLDVRSGIESPVHHSP